MLTTQNDETNILERIKIARGNAEPQEPTEEPQIVDVSEDAGPIEPTEEVAEVEETQEAEEVEEDIEEVAEQDEMYIDLDGEEISLTDIRAWKSGNMMQSDYTRKTTELSEQRKEFEQEREVFTTNQAKLNESIAQLEAVMATEELSKEDLQDLREYEPEKYIEYVEKQNKRKEALQAARSIEQPKFNPQEEMTKLVNNNPQWLDNGKPTEAYQKDQALLNSYAQEIGLSAEQFSQFDASMMQMALDAAKFKAAKNKDAATVKRVRKAPVVTKPKAKATKGIQDQIRAAEAKLKKTGRVEDAAALRKLKAQLNN